MKKFVAIVLVITSLLVLTMGVFQIMKINKTRYAANAICKQQGGGLHFFFDGQEFVWELGAGDRIPKVSTVRLTMESNGTDEYADDVIINYWER
ncbi:MAG: hypothetical protein IJ150_07315 [Bacteroidales bacterium]|nr:hypothetical protein [Bacteroidales bacterium]